MMKTQKGMALITVLLIIAFMTIMAVLGQREWVTALRRADTLQFQQQARWTLLNAETILLKRTPALSSNEPVLELQLEGLRVFYRWRDRQSCFNVNVLGAVTRPYEGTPPPPPVAHRIFLQLLEHIGVPLHERAEMLKMVRRYINPYDDLQWPNLSDKTELRALPFLDEPRWSALSPLICALPDKTLRININAISDNEFPLMLALLGGAVDVIEVGRIFEQRPEKGWAKMDDFVALLPAKAKNAISDLQSVAVTESRHWELTTWIADGRYFAAIRSQFIKDNGFFSPDHRQYGMSDAP